MQCPAARLHPEGRGAGSGLDPRLGQRGAAAGRPGPSSAQLRPAPPSSRLILMGIPDIK